MFLFMVISVVEVIGHWSVALLGEGFNKRGLKSKNSFFLTKSNAIRDARKFCMLYRKYFIRIRD